MFISYSRRDRQYVTKLAGHLATSGVPTWWDFELAAGDPFSDEIQDRIDACAAFIIVLSPDAVASTWVKNELHYALQQHKKILPLLLTPCRVPLQIVSLHQEDVTGESLPNDRFLTRLRTLADVDPPRSRRVESPSDRPEASTARSADAGSDGHPREPDQAASGTRGGGFADLFNAMFTGGRQPGSSNRGGDIEVEAAIDVSEAASGVTIPLRLNSPGVCETCGGGGAKPGTKRRTCPLCLGTGLVSRNQGAFSYSEPCRECQGAGTVVDEKCADCKGSGGITKTRTMHVRIPAGISDGQRIRLKGKGQPGQRGGSPGDLYVLVAVVHDRPGPEFGWSGLNLTITVPVTFPEAVTGTEIRVPTLNGSVTLRIPPGTPSGRVLRVRGKGMRRGDLPAGDLLVTLELQVPDGVTPAARAALAELDALLPGNHSDGASTPQPIEGSGSDLAITVPISFHDAVVGAAVPVLTGDWSLVRLRIPPGTPSGRVLRLSGHGRAPTDGRAAGDLLVTVEIEVPQVSSDEAKAALARFREALQTS